MSWASTVNDTLKTGTTDGSNTDTQTAISYVDAKNQDGWVITVGAPSGSYTWTSAVSMASTFVHSVTIVLNSNVTVTANHAGASAIDLVVTNGKLTRLTALTGGTLTKHASGTFDDFVTVNCSSTTVSAQNALRIDNINFTNCSGISSSDKIITISSPNFTGPAIFGVIDHNTFTNSSAGNGIYVLCGNNANAWSGTMAFGTANAIFIETNVFNNIGSTVPGRPAIDSAYNGAAWVARYNTFTNWVCVSHGADSAPTSTGIQEAYSNNTTVSDGSDYAWYIRGGTILGYNNGILTTGAGFYNSGWKLNLDVSVTPPNAYPWFEQIGQWAVAGTQATIGSYFWGNTYQNVGVGNVTANGAHAADIVLNRDYFLVAPNAGTPLTSYTAYTYPHPLVGGTSGGSLRGGVLKMGGVAACL